MSQVNTEAERRATPSTRESRVEARGTAGTRAEIVRVTWVGARTAFAEVRWPLLDEHHRELGEERSTYTLRLDDSAELKIRAAVIHTPVVH